MDFGIQVEGLAGFKKGEDNGSSQFNPEKPDG